MVLKGTLPPPPHLRSFSFVVIRNGAGGATTTSVAFREARGGQGASVIKF